MIEYPHIDSVFKRNLDGPNKGRFIEGEWTHPEFEYLAPCKWVGTEKVNGTNIRVCWYPNGPDIGIAISDTPCTSVLEFKGKTDKAQPIPALWKKLGGIFTIDLMTQVFPNKDVCLYGEGYGARIQKGGGNYIPDGVDFVLFDIRVGDWWLKYGDCAMIAERLRIKIVPVVGEFTLYEAINFVKHGFTSAWYTLSNPFLAEGLILKPKIDLRFRNGERIVTKIKTEDWK